MYIGAYLCLTGLFYWAGALWLARRNLRLRWYAAGTWTASLVALIVFEILSIWAGLVPYRGAGSFSYPGDYLAHGLTGWLIMLLLPAGFLAPLLVAAWAVRRT